MGGMDKRPLAIGPAAFAIATREVGKTSTPAVPCAQEGGLRCRLGECLISEPLLPFPVRLAT